MHLIIETLDNKIIKSRISQNKKNDNAGTWAFSLGEQMAIEDFCDGKDLKDNFVKNWMKRAFQEEYRLSENDYMNIVDEKSLRILSVDFESDRYNFAMVCTVRLNYRYETFYNQVAPLLSTEEAIELGFIELENIPSILFSYLQKNKEYYIIRLHICVCYYFICTDVVSPEQSDRFERGAESDAVEIGKEDFFSCYVN